LEDSNISSRDIEKISSILVEKTNELRNEGWSEVKVCTVEADIAHYFVYHGDKHPDGVSVKDFCHYWLTTGYLTESQSLYIREALGEVVSDNTTMSHTLENVLLQRDFGIYEGNMAITGYHGDPEANHKWWRERDSERTMLFTFKPCIQEEEGECESYMEKNLTDSKVFFYNSLESNLISIEITKPFVKWARAALVLNVNTLDDSGLSLRWEFVSEVQMDIARGCIDGLFSIISDMERFSQSALFTEIEKRELPRPSHVFVY
jgi:hypothetical protein